MVIKQNRDQSAILENKYSRTGPSSSLEEIDMTSCVPAQGRQESSGRRGPGPVGQGRPGRTGWWRGGARPRGVGRTRGHDGRHRRGAGGAAALQQGARAGRDGGRGPGDRGGGAVGRRPRQSESEGKKAGLT